MNNEITEDQVERIALMHPNGTGAEIKDIVNEALIIAMRAGRATVTWSDLLEAKSFKTHGMPDDVHPVSLERHATAIHEAGHAIAAVRLRKRTAIDVATIEPRGATGGFVSYVPIEEANPFPWRRERELNAMVSMASLAAERLLYEGDNSVGVGGDMGSATQIVATMFGAHAMGTTLASHGVGNAVDSPSSRRATTTRSRPSCRSSTRRPSSSSPRTAGGSWPSPTRSSSSTPSRAKTSMPS